MKKTVLKKPMRDFSLLLISWLILCTTIYIVFTVSINQLFTEIDKNQFLIINVSYAIFSVFLLLFIYKNYTTREELNHKKQYNLLLDQTNDVLREHKANLSGILKDLQSCKSIEESKEFIERIISINDGINNSTLNLHGIKVASVHGLVYSKYIEALANSIEIKLSTYGTLDSVKGINHLDLCEILGILLDNAIEAARDSYERVIEFKIHVTSGSPSFYIKNTFKTQPDLHNIFNDNFSTKGNDRGHGLFIVKNILKKNKRVLLNTTIENGYFVQNLSLN